MSKSFVINMMRFALASFVLFLLGSFLYHSRNYIMLRPPLGLRPLRMTGDYSALLLWGIWIYIGVEMVIFALFFHFGRAHGNPKRQRPKLTIKSVLMGIVACSIPFVFSHLYQFVVAQAPPHPGGPRGLPEWIELATSFSMLLPIAYLTFALTEIMSEEISGRIETGRWE